MLVYVMMMMRSLIRDVFLCDVIGSLTTDLPSVLLAYAVRGARHHGPLARRSVFELLAGMVVVDEQVVLDDQLLMGRVRKGGQSNPDHCDGGEHAEDELRPAVGVAYVDGVDQYPGHGGDQTRNTGGGHGGLLGLYSRRHYRRCVGARRKVVLMVVGTRGGGGNCCLFTGVGAKRK